MDRGGWRLRQGYPSLSVFYLLFYFHLVVQVMNVGMSLGQGSMKAEFLVIERDGWGARKTAVKTRTWKAFPAPEVKISELPW